MFIYYLASSCLLQHAIFTITFLCAFITLKVCNVHHRTLKVNYRNERWSRCKVLSLTATDLQLLHCLLIHLSDVQCRNTRSVTKVYFHHPTVSQSALFVNAACDEPRKLFIYAVKHYPLPSVILLHRAECKQCWLFQLSLNITCKYLYIVEYKL